MCLIAAISPVGDRLIMVLSSYPIHQQMPPSLSSRFVKEWRYRISPCLLRKLHLYFVSRLSCLCPIISSGSAFAVSRNSSIHQADTNAAFWKSKLHRCYCRCIVMHKASKPVVNKIIGTKKRRD
jgi:hypothetical protein